MIYYKLILTFCLYSYSIFALSLLGWINSFSISISSILALASFILLSLKNKPAPRFPKVFLVLLPAFLPFLFLPIYLKDDLLYHFYVPKILANTGSFPADPFNVNTQFPMLFEMSLVFSQLFSFVPPFLPALGTLLLSASFFTYIIRKESPPPHNSLHETLFVTAFFTQQVFFSFAHSGYVDHFFALLIMMGLYAYRNFQKSRKEASYWYWGLAMLSLSCAVKYTGLYFLGAILALEFFHKKNNKLYYRGLLLCLILSSPFYIKNFFFTSNPFYPFLSFLFPSDYLSVARALLFKKLIESHIFAQTFLEIMAAPLTLMSGQDLFHGSFKNHQLSLLFILALAPYLKWQRDNRHLLAVCFFYYLIWIFTSQQVRFLLPIVLFLTPLGYQYILTRWHRKRSSRFISFFLVAALMQNAYHLYGYLKEQKILDYFAGHISKEALIKKHAYHAYLSAAFCNQNLTKNHKIMLIGGFGRSYYYDIPVLANTHHDAEIFAKGFLKESPNPAIILDFFSANKVTHLAIDDAFLDSFFAANHHIDLAGIKAFISAHTRKIYQHQTVRILEITH